MPSDKICFITGCNEDVRYHKYCHTHWSDEMKQVQKETLSRLEQKVEKELKFWKEQKANSELVGSLIQDKSIIGNLSGRNLTLEWVLELIHKEKGDDNVG